LRARFLFLSHTHLDHFIGFDSWMRVHLGTDHTLQIVGPAGVARHVHHKIHGYVWNLAETVYLKFQVTELDPLRTFRILPTTGYELEEVPGQLPILDTRGEWTFRYQPLQHLSIISCGYRLFTPESMRVNEEALAETGFKPGPWVKEMKSRESGLVIIDGKEHDIAELREKLLYHSQGYSITYITDAVYHEENARKMIELARNSDHLFCESSFLKMDADRAARTHHMTTVQAASIARDANVGQLHLFHFSRRYSGLDHVFLKEAREIFPHVIIGARKEDPSGSISRKNGARHSEV